MPSRDTIEQQHKLLAAHRETLTHFMIQRARLGADYVPPSVTHGIHEARAEIRRIKSRLHDWGVAAEDLPDDEELLDVSDVSHPILPLTPIAASPIQIASPVALSSTHVPVDARQGDTQAATTSHLGTTSQAQPLTPDLPFSPVILAWKWYTLSSDEQMFLKAWLAVTVVGWISLGLGLGIIQWQVLGKRLAVPKWQWTADTTAAVLIGWVVEVVLANNIHFLPLSMAMGGIILGLIQWFSLRRLVKAAEWWIWANAASGLVSGLAITASDIIFGLMGATLITGAITGITLIWLLRQPHLGIPMNVTEEYEQEED